MTELGTQSNSGENNSDTTPERENTNHEASKETTAEDEAAIAQARAANAQAFKESKEGVWFLKQIWYNNHAKKIVMQNYNGPCSFIAICNILLLRGDIVIEPQTRTSISYDILAQLVGEYLLRTSPDVDLSAALTIMPLTQKGMDLNPLFTSPTAFRPAGDNGALELFEKANIPLVHGWLVDPSSSREYSVLSETEDYDASVNLLVEADSLSSGQLVVDENGAGPSSAGSSAMHANLNISEEGKKKIEDALVIGNFLNTSSHQLTYHGLFTLASIIQPGALVALFRNSHLSVLHRRSESDDASLYNLVTDYVFHNEPSVVWERIEDVDGSGSTFVDAEFRRSSPAGGDFAGQTAESAFESAHPQHMSEADLADQELAKILQQEEDARAQQMYARRQYQQQQQQQRGQHPHPHQRPHPQYDSNDPRYAHYAQQEQFAQQQFNSQDQNRYPNPNQSQGSYGPGMGTPNMSQNPGNMGNIPRPAHAQKIKRKTSCVIM